jgi:hypothetical protein
MDAATGRLIGALHRSPARCVLALAGGGTQAAALLLNVPGASRTVLEVIVPYHDWALAEFLGHRPEHFCSVATAQALALRSWQRASWLAPGEPAIGIGCTAALVTDRPKRGDHRFFLSVRTTVLERTFALTLAKGQRDREGEEQVLDAVLLNALAAAAGIPERVPTPLLPGEEVAVEERSLHPLLGLLEGRTEVVCVESDGRQRADVRRPGLLLAGSFNPLHAGHWGLAEAAARLVGGPAAFELCVANVDKPPLTVEEVTERLHQLAWRAPVWVTRVPTFAEKARVFPGATFIVGADTAARIIQARYYAEGEAGMARALESFRACGCHFLVGGRTDGAGVHVGIEHLPVPADLRDLFTGIPAGEFRMDISSTALRAGGSGFRS